MDLSAWLKCKDDQDGKAVIEALVELCCCVLNIAPTKAPPLVHIVRQRMRKYLYNGLFFIINYKDFGLTNINHYLSFARFPMNRLLKSRETCDQYYTSFATLLDNTEVINRGYLQESAHKVLPTDDNPFITRGDFDLCLLYFVLIGEVMLSKRVCLAFLQRSTFNPLDDVFNAICYASALERGNRQLSSALTTSTFSTTSAVKLDKVGLALGLSYFGNPRFWSDDRRRAIEIGVSSVKDYTPMLRETDLAIVIMTKDATYIVDGGVEGLYVRTNACTKCVIVWLSDGLGVCRFNTVMDYLYDRRRKNGGRKFERIVLP